MGFRLQQKLMTLNDLERQFTALSSVLCLSQHQMVEAIESRGYYYKVALYHSYIYQAIEFDSNIQWGPLIWGVKIGWGGFQLKA